MYERNVRTQDTNARYNHNPREIRTQSPRATYERNGRMQCTHARYVPLPSSAPCSPDNLRTKSPYLPNGQTQCMKAIVYERQIRPLPASPLCPAYSLHTQCKKQDTKASQRVSSDLYFFSGIWADSRGGSGETA